MWIQATPSDTWIIMGRMYMFLADMDTGITTATTVGAGMKAIRSTGIPIITVGVGSIAGKAE